MKATAHKKTEDNIRMVLMSAFSSQDVSLLMNAFSNESYLENHVELKWFIDIIERTTQAYMDISPGDVCYHTTYAKIRDVIIARITQKLSSCTLGFDINNIIALSGEMQEKAEARDFFLVILPYESCTEINDDMLLIFSKDDQKTFGPHTIHAIRKQLNLAKGGGLAVCKDAQTGEFHTVGVLGKEAAERYPRFFFSKRLKWEFYFPKEEDVCKECRYGKRAKDNEKINCQYTKHRVPCKLCRVRYDQGSLMMPITDITAELKPIIIQYLEKKHSPDPIVIANNIMSVILATDDCDHGAVVIFSSPESIRAEAERLTKKHRGLLLPVPEKITEVENNKLVSRMAAVDGAILVDYEGQCYAYGIILDGKAVVNGNADRGARYNSTNAYIKGQRLNSFMNWYRLITKKRGASFVGVVKSEDGMLNIFFCE